MVEKQKDYLIKLRDGLVKEQIKGSQAAQQFNAGQLNTTARTQAGIEATDQRFNLKQAAIASYLGTQAFTTGGKGADNVLLNEVQQAYSNSPADIQAGMDALGRQFVATTEVPKTALDRDIGRATLFQQYVGDEVRKGKYQMFEAQDQNIFAANDLMETLSPEDRASVERGLEAKMKMAAGKGAAIAGEQGQAVSGGIPTRLVGEPDYSGAIADVDARLQRLAETEAAKAPEKPPEPDLITEQRKEYFKSFFPGYMPAFKQNAIATSLNALPYEDAVALLKLYRTEKRAETLAGRMPAETPLGQEITDTRPTRPPRYAAGKEGPRMAGDVLGGKGSPFIPLEGAIGSLEARAYERQLDEAREELLQRGVMPPEIQKFGKPSEPAIRSEPLPGTEGKSIPSLKQNYYIQQGVPYATIEEEARQKAMEAKKQLDEAKSKGLDEKTIATFQTIYDNELKAYSDIFATGQEPALNEAIAKGPRDYPFPTPKRADRKEVKRLLPDQADLQAKLEAAKEVEKIVDTPEFDKLLVTDVGKATKDIYEANKAKGDESGKEIMKYVAREFPRGKDQKIAAQVVMGLSYKDSNAGKMGQEDFELGGGVVSPEE